MNEAWATLHKTGDKGDASAVQGNNFRVHGTHEPLSSRCLGLPLHPWVFIVTPICMITEKASEGILADAKQVST